MSSDSPSIPIGSKVKVDLEQAKDPLPIDLKDALIKDATGTVIDYKMTDGGGIGIVLKLNNGKINWFFIDEIRALETNSSLDASNSSNDYIFKYGTPIKPFRNKNMPSYRLQRNPPNYGLSIINLFNPKNFFEWLVYSLKDVF